MENRMKAPIVKEMALMSSMGAAPIPSKDIVLSRAREIFGDPRKTWSWLTTPNYLLKNMQPKDLIECGNVDDLNMVLDELARIDQGLF